MNRKEPTFVDPSRFSRGEIYRNPNTGDFLRMTGGYYLDPTYHRLSNFFYWKNLTTGEEECGYGFPLEKVEVVSMKIKTSDGIKEVNI